MSVDTDPQNDRGCHISDLSDSPSPSVRRDTGGAGQRGALDPDLPENPEIATFDIDFLAC
jgi:hypothetical protein